MKLHNSSASIYVPDGRPVEAAVRRTTHLGIGAHPDDLEFMAFHGIQECYQRADRWFGGITCADGAGDPRSGPPAAGRQDDRIGIRRQEQEKAAGLGQYGFVAMLNYSSPSIRAAGRQDLVGDLRSLLALAQPEILYTHNPADKHDTHVAVCLAVIEALRDQPKARRPARVLGCELWRDLDWLPDGRKVVLDVGAGEALAASLNSVYQSQIAAGKRYDLAVPGRRQAHATFQDPRTPDGCRQVVLAMDLTPLVQDDGREPLEWVSAYLEDFSRDVKTRIGQFVK